jgi:hypothetical protein
MTEKDFNRLIKNRKGKNLFIPSSLMFGLLEQFPVLVLAHFFLPPLYNASHRLTSFSRMQQ